jgi:hypothetical protein
MPIDEPGQNAPPAQVDNRRPRSAIALIDLLRPVARISPSRIAIASTTEFLSSTVEILPPYRTMSGTPRSSRSTRASRPLSRPIALARMAVDAIAATVAATTVTVRQSVRRRRSAFCLVTFQGLDLRGMRPLLSSVRRDCCERLQSQLQTIAARVV